MMKLKTQADKNETASKTDLLYIGDANLFRILSVKIPAGCKLKEPDLYISKTNLLRYLTAICRTLSIKNHEILEPVNYRAGIELLALYTFSQCASDSRSFNLRYLDSLCLSHCGLTFRQLAESPDKLAKAARGVKLAMFHLH